MATGTIKKQPTNRIYISGQYATIGRSDGKISITIPMWGKWTSASLSLSSNINADIYGTISSTACKLTLDSISLSGGDLYIRFIPNVTLSNYTAAAKIYLLNINDNTGLYVDLS